MSLLRIFHETLYLYQHPVDFGPHRVILRPREGHDIRVEEMRLEIEPDFAVAWSRDVFGNSVATVDLLAPSATLLIRNHLLLRQTSPFPSRIARPSRSPFYPAEYSPLELGVVAAYQKTVFPEDQAAVQTWAQEIINPAKVGDAEALVSRINREIHDRIRYARRETKGVQTPAETLQAGSGSCRDMATLFLEALRALGFPARFASGYLDCRASAAGQASTHAWAEAYLPTIGWTGYDPTLGEATNHQHVVTGVSNHPRGVMPISGSYFGKEEEFLEMKVRVETERLPESAP